MQKNTKRWIRYGSLTMIMVMILGTAGVAVSGFKGKGPFGHFGKGMMRERIISRMDYTMQELQLTPEQQTKYSQIRARMVSTMEAAQTRHEALRETVETEMAKEQPDLKTLAKTLKTEINTMPDTMTMQIDSMVEMYDYLDKTQQKKLAEILKERMERRHGRRGPGGPEGPMDRS